MPNILRTFLALVAGLPLFGLASPGLSSWEIDDNADFPAFLAFLEARASSPHEALDFSGRVIGHVVDSKARPVPFASWFATEGGRQSGKGRTFADGGLLLYPRGGRSVLAAGSSIGFEVSARGARASTTAVIEAGGRFRATFPGTPPLVQPINCDIVFIIDTTVSMKKYLDAIKSTIDSVGQSVVKEPGLAPRFGLVLFRDLGDEYLVRATPLTADLGSIDATLAPVTAAGGGDIPEDLGAGLRAAVNGMAFADEGLRLVFAFTDAVPALRPGALGQGGSRYADACESALEKGVKIFTIGMGPVSLGGDYALRQIAAYTGAAYLAADTLDPPAPAGGAAIVRGPLEGSVSRIILGEARAAKAGVFDGRDPALILLDELKSRMASRLVYPEAARARRISGTARVEVRIGADGRLVEASVSTSSGSAILDRASLDLARSVFPLENPAESELRLSIQVAFRLE